MTDALTAAPEAPQTDTLVEQADQPKPMENPSGEKPAKPSLDDTLKAEVAKAVKPEPLKAEKPEKVEKAEKPEAKPEAKPEPVKPEPDDDAEAADVDESDKPVRKPSAFKDAPSGFDDAAKAEWEATPESVRGAMHRRQQEMERGLRQHREVAQEYEPLKQYADMAKQSGTDLPSALQRYTSMEQQLRSDPIAGLQAIVANLGLKTPSGQQVTLRDVAAHIMGQPADQQASRQEATISKLTQQVQSLSQQLGGFSQHVEQQQQQAKVASAESEWTAFQRAQPLAVKLEPQIAEFLHKYPAAESIPVTERLHDAYQWAVAQNPSVAHTDAPPLAQTQTQPKPNPAGQKSISGAGGDTRSTRKLSTDEAFKRAISRVTQ